MERLSYIEPRDANPVTKQVYNDAEARFEMVLNVFKITGNAPEIAEKDVADLLRHPFDILREGPSFTWLEKELLILSCRPAQPTR